MGRWLWLSSSVLVIGALSLLDPERAADARALGGACDSTRECQVGLRCIQGEGAMDGQCSAGCSAGSACQEQFGEQSMCLGADVCARACQKAADCPADTHCNVYGWCERAGDR
jgi:hypothetical protein